MNDEIPIGTPIDGPHGYARGIPLPDTPEAAACVCQWLITSPLYHPLWNQYYLAVVSLADTPGWLAAITKTLAHLRGEARAS